MEDWFEAVSELREINKDSRSGFTIQIRCHRCGETKDIVFGGTADERDFRDDGSCEAKTVIACETCCNTAIHKGDLQPGYIPA
jgi:ribosomal protein S27E